MSVEHTLWKREMKETIDELHDNLSATEAVKALRFLISTGMLAHDDVNNDPSKYFHAQRLLARQVSRLGSGLWIRFNLHYNFFAGSVLALGSQQQVERFVKSRQNQERPRIGCFALTEQKAIDNNKHGNGAFHIETTAELSQDENYFIINTPHESAAKNWISQGLVADECILIAKLMVHGHSYGPQAFLIKLRDENGQLIEGVNIIDLGPKSNGSNLDNARITFTHLKVPITTHLCKYLEVRNGTVRHHHALGEEVRTLDILGRNLYTGRVAVAQGALTYTRTVLERASDSLGNRSCLSPSRVGDVAPSISKGFLSQAFVTLSSLENFVYKIEAELRHCLVRHKDPSERIRGAIAVAKVEAVETSIDLCSVVFQTSERPGKMSSARKMSVGSDFLLCCKNAEGESHVLMQMMARDLFSRLDEEDDGREGPVEVAIRKLQRGIMQVQIETGCGLRQAWENCSELVYDVADAHMDSVLESYGCLLKDRRTTYNSY